MSIASPTLPNALTETPSSRPRSEGLRNAPVTWIAIATTFGIAIDRLLGVPIAFALAVGGSALLSALILRQSGRLAFLLLGVAALGAAWHHVRQFDPQASELARLAKPDGTPVRLLGTLVAPATYLAAGDDPLQTIPHPESCKLVVDVDAVVTAGIAEPMRGRIVAYVTGRVADVYPGDEIELVGQLVPPRTAGNPGEFDTAAELRDQGVAAVLSSPGGRLMAHRWPASLLGWLGRLHGECKSILEERLTVEPALATALLLGDGSGLSRPEWDKFLKSGVVHALAISGQHLAILALFLMWIRRVAFVRLGPATIAITLLLLGYAVLTGGRPPAMRAAWMVLVFAFALLLRRPTNPANTLAFAWLVVVAVNPADVFQAGCQLSFMAVALLQWFVSPLLDQPSEFDPFADPIERSRLRNALGTAWQLTRTSYLVSALVWIGVTPLVADRFHVVAPIAILIGPPVVLATSIALVSGFLLLLTAQLLGPLAAPFAWITDASLWCCDKIIDWGLRLPGASFTVGDLPTWWVIAFYVVLGVVVFWPSFRLKWLWPAAAIWMALGLMLGLGVFRPAELRITFLSVGHGGCTVIETSGGRVLVYDAGATSGPDLTRRIIVPYLWSRGIRRIDDLFVSHADLDHFSGVPDLLDRVTVSRVTLTPSFADRRTPAVRRVLADLERRRTPTRIVKAGDSEQIDDVRLDVLHPPAIGPDGKENARSLVMLVRKDSFATLLTGDLEDPGQEMVCQLRPPGVDVFMAPHHGSPKANPKSLAEWAKPRVAISNQGHPRSKDSPAAMYESVGARYLTTFQHGAIAITIKDGDVWLDTYRTKQSTRVGPVVVR